MELCRAEVGHLPQVLALEQEIFSHPWSEVGLRQEWENRDVFFAVALEAGQVWGYLILHGLGPEGEIFRVAVSPARRREHIGEALVRCALAQGADAGMERIFLEVRAGNEPARRLYEKCGFREVGRRKNYYDDPREDAALLRWDAPGTGDDTLC